MDPIGQPPAALAMLIAKQLAADHDAALADLAADTRALLGLPAPADLEEIAQLSDLEEDEPSVTEPVSPAAPSAHPSTTAAPVASERSSERRLGVGVSPMAQLHSAPTPAAHPRPLDALAPPPTLLQVFVPPPAAGEEHALLSDQEPSDHVASERSSERRPGAGVLPLAQLRSTPTQEAEEQTRRRGLLDAMLTLGLTAESVEDFLQLMDKLLECIAFGCRHPAFARSCQPLPVRGPGGQPVRCLGLHMVSVPPRHDYSQMPDCHLCGQKDAPMPAFCGPNACAFFRVLRANGSIAMRKDGKPSRGNPSSSLAKSSFYGFRKVCIVCGHEAGDDRSTNVVNPLVLVKNQKAATVSGGVARVFAAKLTEPGAADALLAQVHLADTLLVLRSVPGAVGCPASGNIARLLARLELSPPTSASGDVDADDRVRVLVGSLAALVRAAEAVDPEVDSKDARRKLGMPAKASPQERDLITGFADTGAAASALVHMREPADVVAERSCASAGRGKRTASAMAHPREPADPEPASSTPPSLPEALGVVDRAGKLRRPTPAEEDANEDKRLRRVAEIEASLAAHKAKYGWAPDLESMDPDALLSDCDDVASTVADRPASRRPEPVASERSSERRPGAEVLPMAQLRSATTPATPASQNTPGATPASRDI